MKPLLSENAIGMHPELRRSLRSPEKNTQLPACFIRKGLRLCFFTISCKLELTATGNFLSTGIKEDTRMGLFGFLSVLNLALYIGGIVFVIYVILQFLKLGRERNDQLQQILEELRGKDSDIR